MSFVIFKGNEGDVDPLAQKLEDLFLGYESLLYEDVAEVAAQVLLRLLSDGELIRAYEPGFDELLANVVEDLKAYTGHAHPQMVANSNNRGDAGQCDRVLSRMALAS